MAEDDDDDDEDEDDDDSADDDDDEGVNIQKTCAKLNHTVLVSFS